MIPLNKEILNSFECLKSDQKDFAQFRFEVPQNLSYFIGHFPDNPVLPAVAIMDISHFFINQAFHEQNPLNSYKEVPQLKIKTSVLPNQICIIEVLKKDESRYEVFWKSSDQPVAEITILF